MGTAELSSNDSGSPDVVRPGSVADVDRPKIIFHRPELDILRFVAFLMVFSAHALGALPQARHLKAIGARGVDLFFVLSAYLITEILLREQRKLGSISLQKFYMRRILRIWPLYFSFLGFMMFLAPRFLPGEHFSWPQRVAFLVFLGNWRFLFPGAFATRAAILWSVSVEEQFYLIWPLLVRGSRQWRVPICLALLMVGIVYRMLLIHFRIRGIVHEESTFSRWDGILAGGLLAFMLDGGVPRLSRPQVWGLLALGCFVLAGLLPISGAVSAVLLPTIVAGGCAAVLVASLSLEFRCQPLESLGKISYGLYVFHSLMLDVAILTIHKAGTYGWMERAVAAFAFTVVASACSYRWLESPFLRLKDRFAVVHRVEISNREDLSVRHFTQ